MKAKDLIDEMEKLRVLFLKRLTIDSETQDARRKDFNQAIFDAKEGWAVFNGTDLDMVMEKFDAATRELERLKNCEVESDTWKT